MSNIPEKIIKRNEFGLVEGVDYVFDQNSKIDWRKMVKPEYLVPNKQVTSETDLSKLNDNELLILLQGIKELAELRGYSKVTYKVNVAGPEYCHTTCSIDFIPNFETENRPITFESTGDASLDSTDGFGKYYLGPISENRAFVRCVRNFLRINIVGKDEVSNSVKSEVKSNSGEAGKKQIKILTDLMEKKHILFDPHIIKKLKDEGKYKDEYTSVEKLPKDIIFDLIERLKKFEP